MAFGNMSIKYFFQFLKMQCNCGHDSSAPSPPWGLRAAPSPPALCAGPSGPSEPPIPHQPRTLKAGPPSGGRAGRGSPSLQGSLTNHTDREKQQNGLDSHRHLPKSYEGPKVYANGICIMANLRKWKSE